MQLNLDLSKKSRLLVIDDEPMMQNLYRAIFEDEDIICDYVLSGPDALEQIRIGPSYDLVLLDIMMPGMSGHEVCQILRRDYLPSELPIIAVTGKEEEGDLIKGFSLGVNDYLKKPFTPLELLARVKAQLNLLEINRAYQRFVPNEFLQVLGRDSIVSIDLGDQVEGEMTVLFADIRQFAAFSEKLSPKQNFQLLNDYLQLMTPIVRRHNGFIDKFVGDEIMALFPHDPDDAIQAAEAMVSTAARMVLPQPVKELAPLRIGVGLHTGRVMLGTIGDKLRMDVTVISDAVNLASRLEALTKTYNCPIIISADTLEQCKEPDRFTHALLGEVKVEGKEQRVSVYRVGSPKQRPVLPRVVDQRISIPLYK